jgi:methylmalonyl-CoA/ethylmalonyl-CoA epimerase
MTNTSPDREPASGAQKSETGARLSHVGIALRANADAAGFFGDVLGLPSIPIHDSDGARIEGFAAGEAVIELLEPAAEDTPIGRFIARRGAGIHHLCFAVPDLDGALQRCRAAGIRLIDEQPRAGAEGKRIAFLHPGSTGGILIELTDP